MRRIFVSEGLGKVSETVMEAIKAVIIKRITTSEVVNSITVKYTSGDGGDEIPPSDERMRDERE